MKTWIAFTSALIDASMSAWWQRFREHISALRPASTIARTASNSPGEFAGNPASTVSTPRSSRTRAIRTLS